MTVFVCVDDNFGLSFNKRRQSRDSAVVEKITEMSKGGRLYITPFSAKLFEGIDAVVADDIFAQTDEDAFCFVEDVDLAGYEERISTLVLFKWNRAYPSDKKLTLDFGDFKLKEAFDFVGTSHEKITCEVWKK